MVVGALLCMHSGLGSNLPNPLIWGLFWIFPDFVGYTDIYIMLFDIYQCCTSGMVVGALLCMHGGVGSNLPNLKIWGLFWIFPYLVG